MGNPRMLVIFTFATLLVVGVIVSLRTDNWLFLVLALAVHALGTFVVLKVLGKAFRQQEKPDPVVEAREEAEAGESGDSDPGGDEPRMAI